MRAGIAQIVPPNTWRVVGDRLRDDEAYIPINRSFRSQNLLAETADRMGFALVRMFAEGGIHSGSQVSMPQPAAPGAAPTINNNYYVRDDQTAYEVGRVASAQQAWELRLPR